MSEDTGTEDVNGNILKGYITRIENLNEEKKALSDDIKEVYAEAKGNGFDPKILKAIVKIRSLDKDELNEQETLIDLYMAALAKSED